MFLRLQSFLVPGLFTLGLSIMAMAMFFQPAEEFLAAAVVEIGAAVALIAPIVFVERRLGARLRSVEATVDDTRAGVADANARLDSLTTTERISAEVAQRLAAAREDDESLFNDVAADPTAEGVRAAIDRGVEIGTLSQSYPRVSLFDTRYLVRFRPSEEHLGLQLVLENQAGDELRIMEWQPSLSFVELGVEIGEYLQAQGQYPGDIAFQPGSMFEALGSLLRLTYRRKTGAGDLTRPLNPVIQMFRQWAITDLGLEDVEGRSYQITSDRFAEIDWDRHVTSKGWVDAADFRLAFETAQLLLAHDRLPVVVSSRYPSDGVPPDAP